MTLPRLRVYWNNKNENIAMKAAAKESILEEISILDQLMNKNGSKKDNQSE
jgi:hypothetical protein